MDDLLLSYGPLGVVVVGVLAAIKTIWNRQNDHSIKDDKRFAELNRNHGSLEVKVAEVKAKVENVENNQAATTKVLNQVAGDVAFIRGKLSDKTKP